MFTHTLVGRVSVLLLIRETVKSHKRKRSGISSLSHLVILRLFRRLLDQSPPALSVLVLLVLDRQLAKVADDVLHLSVVDVAVRAAKVGEAGNLVEREVDDGDDDGDANRVGPKNYNCGNRGVAGDGLLVPPLRVWIWEGLLVDVRVEPAEDTEEGGNCVDATDSSDKLP